MIINSKGCDFNPRPPRGGRHFKFKPISKWVDISIHVLREEDDPFFAWQMSSHRKFQSTSSARRTTGDAHTKGSSVPISIHVLREEDDSWVLICPTKDTNFNPRPPRGGRRSGGWLPWAGRYFNPRPPRGGRRYVQYPIFAHNIFQSTSSARRTTGHGHQWPIRLCHFNPRPPRGGRLMDIMLLVLF